MNYPDICLWFHKSISETLFISTITFFRIHLFQLCRCIFKWFHHARLKCHWKIKVESHPSLCHYCKTGQITMAKDVMCWVWETWKTLSVRTGCCLSDLIHTTLRRIWEIWVCVIIRLDIRKWCFTNYSAIFLAFIYCC